MGRPGSARTALFSEHAGQRKNSVGRKKELRSITLAVVPSRVRESQHENSIKTLTTRKDLYHNTTLSVDGGP
jgi:hypothetical protein